MPSSVKSAAQVFVGIDPGASGGFAAINLPLPRAMAPSECRLRGVVAESFANRTDREIWELFQFLPENAVAVIEQNSGYVGGAGNPGSAMFKFGLSTGKLHGYLVAAKIVYREVTPRTWQKALGIPARKKSESKTEFKRRLKTFCERRYPSVPVTLATCDALLIATYCVEIHK